MSNVLDLEQHGYDKGLLQAGYYFFLLSLDSIREELGLGGSLFVGGDSEVLTFQLRIRSSNGVWSWESESLYFA